jgi:hypothetical protein
LFPRKKIKAPLKYQGGFFLWRNLESEGGALNTLHRLKIAQTMMEPQVRAGFLGSPNHFFGTKDVYFVLTFLISNVWYD